MSLQRALTLIGCGSVVAAACAQPCGNPWTQWPGQTPAFGTSGYPTQAYDSVRQKVVLLGFISAGVPALTLEWDGSGAGTWTQRAVTSFNGRSDAAMTYDSARGVVILHGGTASAVVSAETWEWDGVAPTWTLKSTAGGARYRSVMAYDVARGKTVRYGGLPQSGPWVPDTWEWDGTTWTQIATTSPGAGGGASLVYDSARGKIVLVGRDIASVHGVWTWDGAVWTREGTGGLPTTFLGYAGFDPIRARTIIIGKPQINYGPLGPGSPPIEFWQWDGLAWSFFLSSPTPTHLDFGSPTVFDGSGMLLANSGLGPTFSYQTWRLSSTLSPGPVMTDSPLTPYQLVPSGANVVYHATATAGATYQWLKNGTPLTDGGHVSGAASQTLTINPAMSGDMGLYAISATNGCGTITRAPVILAVECYANCDNSVVAPVLNPNDFQCFLNVFAAGCQNPPNCYANCDGSTVAPLLTANDFQCFLNAYATGCP